MAAACLTNRAAHEAFKMEAPFKVLDGEEANLSYLCVIGGKPFVEVRDRTLDAAAWGGKVCGHSGESDYYRVWSPKPHHVVKSRKVALIETPPHLLPQP